MKNQERGGLLGAACTSGVYTLEAKSASCKLFMGEGTNPVESSLELIKLKDDSCARRAFLVRL